MSLPTTPSDLPYPTGNSWSIRSGADQLRSTIEQLRTARVAAIRIEDITAGAHWRGDAFEAFKQAASHKPLPAAIDHASERMEQAASQLDSFAARFDRNVDTIRWCRSRLAALGIEGGEVPDELVGEVQRIGWDAEQAWDDHRAALRSVADLFDWLDDEPTFAKPPPSNWDRVTGAVDTMFDFTNNILIGTAEAVVEMAKLAAEISLFVNPLTGPFKMYELWQNRDEFLAILDYAWNNPGEFALEFGKALIDLDTWREDGIGRWIGHRIPDLVLTLATGGYGAIGRGAALSVRGMRGGHLAAKFTDALALDRYLRPLTTMESATDAADLLGATGFFNRANRMGADAAALDRVTVSGAFAHADTKLGQMATRFDGNPIGELGRQVPGVISDEIKAFTQLPTRYLQQRFSDNTVIQNLTPGVQSKFDNIVTNGWTGRLGIMDGLLVGAPALSPQTRQAMGAVLGTGLLNDLTGTVGVGAELASDAEAAGF